MNNSIPNWMKKWLDLFNKETQIRNQEFIPTESEIDNEVTLTIKYDEWDKQPYMSKEQQELLDEAYLNYSYSCIRETKKQEHEMKEKGGWLTLCLTPFFENKEEFINKCKTDLEFSKTWGLKIEERELDLGERQAILDKNGYRGLLNSNAKNYKSGKKLLEVIKKTCDDVNIPTKLITTTYNNKTIESYEHHR